MILLPLLVQESLEKTKLMLEKIFKKTEQLEEELIKIRRHFHQNPELSCQEYKTADFIYKKLLEAGIEANLINTESGPAVIAQIISDKNTKTIAFRADMDALPLCDGIDKNYCSKNNGVAHACGHDFNMTSILGTAFVLASIKEELKCNVKFIFQPSEEKSEGGAAALVKKDIMRDVDAIFAVHAFPSLPAGQIGLKSGVLTAAADFFNITIKGKGGHCARPQEAADSILAANNVLNYLYGGLSRNIDPMEPFVVSIGEIHAGNAPNIIAETCQITGTTRTFSKEVRKQIQELISSKSQEIAGVYNTEAEIKWDFGSPSVINNDELALLVEKTAAEFISKENIVKLPQPGMGAEDFSRYLDFAKGMLIRIGTGGENCSYPLHNCLFDIDESAIRMTVKLLSAICVNYQNNIHLMNKDADEFVV
jgi:amidohydrolase